MSGMSPGSMKAKLFGQLGVGGSAWSTRDDGWGLRDSEGWCRCRHGRPATLRDLIILDEKGFAGLAGGFDGTRYTLALASDGRRVSQAQWRDHQAGVERSRGSSCSGSELVGNPREDWGWQTMLLVWYSWLRADQRAAPSVALYLGAMMSRPQEINRAGARPSYIGVASSNIGKPTQEWAPYLERPGTEWG